MTNDKPGPFKAIIPFKLAGREFSIEVQAQTLTQLFDLIDQVRRETTERYDRPSDDPPIKFIG